LRGASVAIKVVNALAVASDLTILIALVLCCSQGEVFESWDAVSLSLITISKLFLRIVGLQRERMLVLVCLLRTLTLLLSELSKVAETCCQPRNFTL
jgi:hypothetical protein